MNTIDVAIILVFLIYVVWNGLRARAAASQGLEAYFLAGRQLNGWQAGISMAATQFAADTPLLVTGLIATAGVFALWQLWIYAIAFLLMGFLFAPCWRRAAVLTDAEFSELRYGSRAASALRGIKAVYFGTIVNCTILAMVLLAATRLAEPILLWHLWLPSGLYEPLRHAVEAIGVPFTLTHKPATLSHWALSTNNILSIGTIVLVTLFYSTTGGLRSVVTTDIVQFAVAIGTSACFAWYLIDHLGGRTALHTQLHALYTPAGPADLTFHQLVAFTPSDAKYASWAILSAYALQWLLQMNADGTGYLAQRSMACRSARDATVAAVVFTVVQVLIRSLIWIPLGLGLLLVFPPTSPGLETHYAAEREFTYVRGIVELLPHGLLGLALVGMLAALASTIDTHLNWGSSYWTNDIYRRFICEGWLRQPPRDRDLVRVARWANVLILLIAVALVPMLSSIQTAWHMSLLFGAGIGLPLILRWLWWRMNVWGELAGILTSLILAPVLLWQDTITDDALRLLLMGVTAGIACVAVSLLTPPESTQQLVAFYRRAQPPGFWTPIAQQLPPNAVVACPSLWNALAATGITAMSVFCLLTGIGSWLSGTPAPTWMPWPNAWLGGLTALGLSLFPVGMWMGFRQIINHHTGET